MGSPAPEGENIFDEPIQALAAALPEFLKEQRWFGGKARTIRSAEVTDAIPVPDSRFDAHVLIVGVEFASGTGDRYVVPVIRVESAGNEPALKVRSESQGREISFANALANEDFLSALFEMIRNEAVLKGAKGELRAARTKERWEVTARSGSDLRPKLLKGEQSNSSVIYGDRFILKLIRRMEEGINPDLEIGFFLSAKAHFKNVPPLEGSIEYRADGGEATAGILQGLVLNQGDGWRFTMNALARFWEEVQSSKAQAPPIPTETAAAGPLGWGAPPETARTLIGSYLDAIRTLAQRTAEMHLALVSDPHDPAFCPEPFTPAFQRDLEQSVQSLTEKNLGILGEKLQELSGETRKQAKNVLNRRNEILREFHATLGPPIHAMRTRVHGDYHLGQVLYTGADFMIIDFEGEPTRPLRERRVKRSPLQDVAGMMRSFHYAPFASLLAPAGGEPVAGEQLRRLIPWAEAWSAWVMADFLRSYLGSADAAPFIPAGAGEAAKLLRLHLLEKAIYELGYELNNRPTWVGIPLAGISHLLNTTK
jgi:maltose alpha-D-glucosyltransferase / alpha-amylase